MGRTILQIRSDKRGGVKNILYPPFDNVWYEVKLPLFATVCVCGGDGRGLSSLNHGVALQRHDVIRRLLYFTFALTHACAVDQTEQALRQQQLREAHAVVKCKL